VQYGVKRGSKSFTAKLFSSGEFQPLPKPL
jgi:hypothetical protein